MVNFLVFLVCYVLSGSLPAVAENRAMNIARSYSLLSGVSSCASTIHISANDTTLPASLLMADKEKCTGGSISLGPVVPRPSDELSQVLSAVAVAGGVRLGTLDSQLTCGSFIVSPQSRIYFATPSSDVKLPDMDIPELGDLAPVLGQAFSFLEGQAYIFVGTQCVYMSSGSGEHLDGANSTEGANSTGNPLESSCFPADATVTLAGGNTRRVDELRIGDEVNVGGGKTSPVFAWTHHDREHASHYYIRISAGQKVLTVTQGHFVYANGEAVPSEKVRKGDVMHGADGEALVVQTVSRVWSKGLYNPQTVHGDIVVDGFIVTTYTSAVVPSAAHALLAPLRAFYTAIRYCLPSIFVST